MKKITLFLMKGCMFLTFIPCQLNAQIASVSTTTEIKNSETEDASKSTILMSRLKEIKAMDKSTLTVSEKKDSQNELKTMRSNSKEGSRGVYLSVGAIIIIILLLILIL